MRLRIIAIREDRKYSDEDRAKIEEWANNPARGIRLDKDADMIRVCVAELDRTDLNNLPTMGLAFVMNLEIGKDLPADAQLGDEFECTFSKVERKEK